MPSSRECHVFVFSAWSADIRSFEEVQECIDVKPIIHAVIILNEFDAKVIIELSLKYKDMIRCTFLELTDKILFIGNNGMVTGQDDRKLIRIRTKA